MQEGNMTAKGQCIAWTELIEVFDKKQFIQEYICMKNSRQSSKGYCRKRRMKF
jgi:hypothetical protein